MSSYDSEYDDGLVALLCIGGPDAGKIVELSKNVQHWWGYIPQREDASSAYTASVSASYEQVLYHKDCACIVDEFHEPTFYYFLRVHNLEADEAMQRIEDACRDLGPRRNVPPWRKWNDRELQQYFAIYADVGDPYAPEDDFN